MCGHDYAIVSCMFVFLFQCQEGCFGESRNRKIVSSSSSLHPSLLPQRWCVTGQILPRTANVGRSVLATRVTGVCVTAPTHSLSPFALPLSLAVELPASQSPSLPATVHSTCFGMFSFVPKTCSELNLLPFCVRSSKPSLREWLNI